MGIERERERERRCGLKVKRREGHTVGTVVANVVEGYEHADDDVEVLKIKSKQRPTWQRLLN